MTNHPDKAREVAADDRETFAKDIFEIVEGRFNKPGTIRELILARLDAFLAASLPADVGEVTMALREFAIAERKRHGGKTNVYEATLADRAADTIALLSAQLAAAEREVDDHRCRANSFEQQNAALESQLTAQKAAHAKMLRDRASEIEADIAKADMCPIDLEIAAEIMCPELRRLADKIEGTP